MMNKDCLRGKYQQAEQIFPDPRQVTEKLSTAASVDLS
jgi:hypothetical protein